MSRTVFILGAGASKAAGAPLMNDFFDAAEAIRRSGIASVDNGSFDLVFDGLAELTNLNAKATVDPHNLEAVFGAFEMAVMCKRLGNLPSEQIAQLGLAIRRVIVDTLEGSMQFPIQDGEVMAPSPYGDFLALIRKMNQADMGSVSVATLNYDIALDYAVYRAGSSIDYGLPGSRGTFPIMKLHGSLNWTRCAKCGGTVPLDLPALIAGYDLTRSLIRGAQYVRLPVRKRLVQIKHCELPCEAEPLIVPPTWNKAQYRLGVGMGTRRRPLSRSREHYRHRLLLTADRRVFPLSLCYWNVRAYTAQKVLAYRSRSVGSLQTIRAAAWARCSRQPHLSAL